VRVSWVYQINNTTKKEKIMCKSAKMVRPQIQIEVHEFGSIQAQFQVDMVGTSDWCGFIINALNHNGCHNVEFDDLLDDATINGHSRYLSSDLLITFNLIDGNEL
jgi:hypothetical protein